MQITVYKCVVCQMHFCNYLKDIFLVFSRSSHPFFTATLQKMIVLHQSTRICFTGFHYVSVITLCWQVLSVAYRCGQTGLVEVLPIECDDVCGQMFGRWLGHGGHRKPLEHLEKYNYLYSQRVQTGALIVHVYPRMSASLLFWFGYLIQYIILFAVKKTHKEVIWKLFKLQFLNLCS